MKRQENDQTGLRKTTLYKTEYFQTYYLIITEFQSNLTLIRWDCKKINQEGFYRAAIELLPPEVRSSTARQVGTFVQVGRCKKELNTYK